MKIESNTFPITSDLILSYTLNDQALDELVNSVKACVTLP